MTGDDVVVALRGQYSHENCAALRAPLAETVMASKSGQIRVDLADVTSMDSLALGALISGYKARAGGRAFVLTSCSPFVHETLAVTSLLGVFMPTDRRDADA